MQHAGPEQPHGAELRQSREHVLARGESHADGADEISIVEAVEPAQVAHGLPQHGAQLFRIGRTGLVPVASVGIEERTDEAAAGQRLGSLRILQAKAEIQPFGVQRLAFDKLRQGQGAAALEPQGDGMQVNVMQDAGQGIHVQSEAPCRGTLPRHQRQSGCAIGEVIERLEIGLVWVGMVGALADGPGLRERPSGARPGLLSVERLQPESIRRGVDQARFEAVALENRLHALHPAGAVKGREFGRQGQFGHGPVIRLALQHV